jgi:outer membrane receptor for ferrienterochelin and colicin
LVVDIGLFHDRISLSVDVYNNSSKDLLLNVPIASTYGYATQLQNVGRTSNKGVELQLNATVMRKKDFNWTANYNMSFNKNRVEQLGQNQHLFLPRCQLGRFGSANRLYHPYRRPGRCYVRPGERWFLQSI